MKNRRINGTQLERMLKNGVANLMLHEQELNDLNVFPVPDGDTGTNMLQTLEGGIAHTARDRECGPYLKELSGALLLSARGNSGVILSQIFTGFALEVGKCPLLGPGELRNALIRGYKNAYAVTIKPVEGTILTVCREGIEHIRYMITRSSCVEEILAMYIAEMRKSLDNTPKMLTALKESGVIDSGALGYIYLFEGMLKYLYGEIIETTASESLGTNSGREESEDNRLFNENSDFEDGYCMEFVLQLMRGDKYSQHFKLDSYIEDLNYYGSSLVVARDGQRVKVHIHTFKPARVMALSQEFGEFLTFKLENMQLQHNRRASRVTAKREHVPFAVATVSFGEGMNKLFRQFGCREIIECSGNMGISSEEFLMAVKNCNADTVVILPNDGDLIFAAEQAAGLNKDNNCRVVVIPSRSPAEGYFALAMDIQDSNDYELRITQMKRGIENVVTLSEVTAAKEYLGEYVSCNVGEEVAIIDKTPVCKGSDCPEAVISGLEKIENINDFETAILFRGAGMISDAGRTLEERIRETLEDKYPLLEMTFVDGGQKDRNWIVGLS